MEDRVGAVGGGEGARGEEERESCWARLVSEELVEMGC